MARSRSTKSASTSTATLRQFLLRQDPGWLVDQLLQIAEDDPLVAAHLQAASGADRTGLVDLSGLRRELASAIQPSWYVEYGAVAGYAHGIDRVLDEVQRLIDEGFPEAAIEAAEYALTLLEDALGQVDDSDGEMGSLAARAQEIHLAACEQARPDAVELGERLARWALRSDWEIFLDSARAYADLLGEPGLARFEAVVDEQWLTLRQLKPGDDKRWDDNRFRPTHLKEMLAARRGVDALVEVIAHDLASSYQFWRAAQTLAEVGRVEDALGWLERGQASFPDSPDGRLSELAADLHARAGRPQAATDIAWQQFTDRPSLPGYQRLREFAVAAGVWAERREAALAVLRNQPTATTLTARPSWAEPPGHSTLVEVLMWEGDIDAAWQAAQHGGCTRPLWLELARARGRQDPGDAMPILRREVLTAIDGGKRPAYHQAAKLAKELRGYATRAGRPDEADEWIRQVRAANARRRALQDEFNNAGLPH
ncbi:hypothetical protein RB614_03295 [Phytohabitans sp. ZYX-F-186]|uniref:SWIM zinc finger domain-containing protein n=1 Tax=Phytohabitans maris TaxID=3071409 RepID=A0ABU0Z916_9ACTN|nr:DUF6880 family protein [Phytohabitans sp. ZYX-F-186]MDQ7903538.1 hypothetical protein [Phytohabitans sp. ZYX-F-186]